MLAPCSPYAHPGFGHSPTNHRSSDPTAPLWSPELVWEPCIWGVLEHLGPHAFPGKQESQPQKANPFKASSPRLTPTHPPKIINFIILFRDLAQREPNACHRLYMVFYSTHCARLPHSHSSYSPRILSFSFQWACLRLHLYHHCAPNAHLWGTLPSVPFACDRLPPRCEHFCPLTSLPLLPKLYITISNTACFLPWACLCLILAHPIMTLLCWSTGMNIHWF